MALMTHSLQNVVIALINIGVFSGHINIVVIVVGHILHTFYSELTFLQAPFEF